MSNISKKMGYQNLLFHVLITFFVEYPWTFIEKIVAIFLIHLLHKRVKFKLAVENRIF